MNKETRISESLSLHKWSNNVKNKTLKSSFLMNEKRNHLQMKRESGKITKIQQQLNLSTKWCKWYHHFNYTAVLCETFEFFVQFFFFTFKNNDPDARCIIEWMNEWMLPLFDYYYYYDDNRYNSMMMIIRNHCLNLEIVIITIYKKISRFFFCFFFWTLWYFGRKPWLFQKTLG